MGALQQAERNEKTTPTGNLKPDLPWPTSTVSASAMIRAAPRGDPEAPFRRRWAMITGALVAVDTVARSALMPRTPE
jgi:hypothetical protein